MTFYREQFPQATVIPKMHMLEKHVVDWLDQWQVGIGLMGEQGAEAHNLKVTYRQHSKWSPMYDETALCLHPSLHADLHL